MRRILLLLALFAAAPFASAQLNRTAVSVKGLDTNPCTPTLPCRTFAQAMTQTNSGGELIVLDSGGYGPVLVFKSVSIIAAPGVYAGITAGPAYDGVAGTIGAADRVVVRGLSIKSLGGNNGIFVGGGGIVHVENCAIDGFANDGINTDSKLIVQDTVIRFVLVGIRVRNTSGNSSAVIDSVRFQNISGHALLAANTARVSMRNGVANTGSFLAFAAHDSSELNLENCAAMNFFYGVIAYDSSTIRVSNSVLTDNSDGIGVFNTSLVESWQNNQIRGNGFKDIDGVVTNVTQN